MKKIILLASLAFSINAFGQVPNNGLIAWYPFNGTANDATGNGNNGTVSGAIMSTDRFGNTNSAYSFNGTSSFINIGNSNTIKKYQTDYSISAWVNSIAFSTLYNQSIISNRSVTNGGSKFGIGGSWNSIQGKLEFEVNGGGNSDLVKSANPMVLNNWYHVCVTYKYMGSNNNIAKLYVNGTLVNTDTLINNTPDPGTQTNYIGFESYSGAEASSHFNGKIDDIRIYNRVLTSPEITLLNNESVCYTNITVTDTLLINTNITGFNPITYQNTIKIYPNPTNDHITIDNGNIANLTGYQMKITNSLGQQVFQSAINQQQFYVSLSTWTGNGIYFVHIIDGQGNTIDIKKIVLQ